MKFFWIDNNLKVTYDQFLFEALISNKNNIYIKNDNPYVVFLHLIRNFICGKKSVILDSRFSDVETLNLGITKKSFQKGIYTQTDLSTKINTVNDLFMLIDSKKELLEIEIFTSGTTGRPKKVIQSFKNLIRAVKEKSVLKKNVWGFAYNPSHFAGLQVFFQAFYNKNTMVYLFDKPYSDVYKDIKKFSVTHLSCTPTFMKMLLPFINEPIYTVESLTFGGEKYNSKLDIVLQEKFPKAKLNNIYASTEAGSLLRSDGEYFSIPNRYKNLIKIKKNELIIHKELIGKSRSFKFNSNWYHTGDIVEIFDENKFRFASRKSEMINVGGYKVNPVEIENIISKIDGIIDVMVTGRKNSITGQIIVANVQIDKKFDETTMKRNIKKITSSELIEYKVPRIIKFVNNFELTRTGKIKKSM